MKIGTSLCGGGAMGVISAIIIEAIEKNIGKPINEITHSFAGTSIGGILALAYSIGHVSNTEILDIFTKHTKTVFKKDGILGVLAATYGNEGLLYVLNEYFGAYKMHHCKVPTTVTARNFEKENVYFSSKEFKNLSVIHAAAATAAAPMYFKPYHFEYDGVNYITYDGGLFAQNPADVLLADFLQEGTPLKDILIINIGTGWSKEYQQKIKNPNKLKTAKIVIDECLDSQLDHVNRTMTKLLGDRYINFDLELPSEINQMDKIQYMDTWIDYAKKYVNSEDFFNKILKIQQYDDNINS
jgi:patatin-like phospholipase/acyl hydrolase